METTLEQVEPTAQKTPASVSKRRAHVHALENAYLCLFFAGQGDGVYSEIFYGTDIRMVAISIDLDVDPHLIPLEESSKLRDAWDRFVSNEVVYPLSKFFFCNSKSTEQIFKTSCQLMILFM